MTGIIFPQTYSLNPDFLNRAPLKFSPTLSPPFTKAASEDSKNEKWKPVGQAQDTEVEEPKVVAGWSLAESEGNTKSLIVILKIHKTVYIYQPGFVKRDLKTSQNCGFPL